MAAEIKKTNAEELSYLDIVRRKADIKIPLIQRDYAQGRPGPKPTDIRDRFVKDLYKAIMHRKALNLHFVYGATDGKRFMPLDGQQRLTTLFLLYVYLDAFRGRHDDDIEFIFTYETRDSSRLFCEKLTVNRYHLFNDHTLEPRKDAEGKEFKPTPSSVIRDQPWWLMKWNADPTIDGMLRMLDTIDAVFFAHRREAAENLFSPDSNLIRFQFLQLENFHDPDDLFIKMNARGLPLTEFEIFKGKWMERIEAIYPPKKVREMKSLIDVHWTDFLWPMRRQGKTLRNIDPLFRNLLKLVIGNAAASLGYPATDYDILFKANDRDITFSYDKYVHEYGVTFDKAMLDRIAEALGELCSPDSLFTRLRENRVDHEQWLDLDREWSFFVLDGSENNPNYKGRIILYAISRFSCLFPKASDREINDWARLIHNLSQNTRFDNSGDAVRTIRDIDAMLAELLTYSHDHHGSSCVNDWVAQSLFEPSGFSKSQWWEEKIKAELRKDPEWNVEITEAERNRYMDGKIGVILWCAGEIGDFTPFDKERLRRDLASFRLYMKKCLSLFDEAGRKDSQVTADFLLVRALLAKGDYMPELSYNRRNLYNDPAHRDYSWKALFSISKDTKVRSLEILKEVIDDSAFNPHDVAGSLLKISRLHRGGQLPLWRRMLTSDYAPEILRHSRQGFLALDHGRWDDLLIYRTSRRSGYNAALYPLYLECVLRKSRKDADVAVFWNTGTDNRQGIMVNGVPLYYTDGSWNDSYTEFPTQLTTLRELVEFLEKKCKVSQ